MELKPIPNCLGYSITRDSRVKNTGTGRWLRSYLIDKRFYVTLGAKNVRRVARLVLETFIGPCPEGMACRHLDGNKQNDALGNLCWGTHVENILDRTKHGRTTQGEKNGNSKLTNKQATEIRQALASNVTQKVLATRYHVSQMAISNINTQKTYKEV